jgi:hypothetical protein
LFSISNKGSNDPMRVNNILMRFNERESVPSFAGPSVRRRTHHT